MGVYSVYTFTVADKKTRAAKNYKNLFAIRSSSFPPATTGNYAGPNNSILTETYQLTSLDPATGVR